LLLLLEKPTHGYDLMERLAGEDGMPDADAGLLYRTLRQFERQGLVESTWDTDVPGPARRRYQVTGEGVEYLHAWALNIRRIRERLDRFLSAYDERFKTSEGR
jgi:poly-beta-hydroxybutyrate-responsive repressor